MQATKWLKLPLFLNVLELNDLLAFLGKVFLVPLSGVFKEGLEVLTPSQFSEYYGSYIQRLMMGEPSNPDRKLITAWTYDVKDIEVKPVETGVLVRPKAPVVQVQPYWLNYSERDGKFHEMALSTESMGWGLLFSFPQLFQDPDTLEILKVQGDRFPNCELFKKLQAFSRARTIPTPFITPAGSLNHPARIGKEWLNEAKALPQLARRNLKI
jgi:hypothetical protein